MGFPSCFIMDFSIGTISLCVLLSVTLGLKTKNFGSTTNLKAASNLVNCGCQCSGLTFRDSNNIIHGNCKSSDATGAFWCYVDSSHHGSCEDLQPSSRFPNNPWSYQACATPEESSYECQAFGTSAGSGSTSSSGSPVCKEKRCLSAEGGYGSTGVGVTITGSGACQCPACPTVTTPMPLTVNPRDPSDFPSSSSTPSLTDILAGIMGRTGNNGDSKNEENTKENSGADDSVSFGLRNSNE